MAKARDPLLIGIDVGMTCTGKAATRRQHDATAESSSYLGVAYIIKSPDLEMVEPRTIQKWPGNGNVKADKVVFLASSHGGHP
jgi:hypothetical protein